MSDLHPLLFPLLHLQAHEDSQESLTSLPRRDTMGSFLPDSGSYELLTVIGTWRLSVSRFTCLRFIITRLVSIVCVCVCFRPGFGRLDDGEPGSIQTHGGARSYQTDRPGVVHQRHGHLPAGVLPVCCSSSSSVVTANLLLLNLTTLFHLTASFGNLM